MSHTTVLDEEQIPESQGIYVIRNSKDGKVYVGSSINIKKRIGDHFRCLNRGDHHSSKFQRAYNKSIDKNVFISSVLELVDDSTVLHDREQYWIDTLSAFKNGYNCTALVNNPAYAEKNVKKKESKKKCDDVYDRFFKIYDRDKIKIGRVNLVRINSRHYKYDTMNALTSLLEFLLDLYCKNSFYLGVLYRSNSLYVDVHDSNGNRFVEYSWRAGKPRLIMETTDMIRNYLAHTGAFDETLHVIRESPIVVIE